MGSELPFDLLRNGSSCSIIVADHKPGAKSYRPFNHRGAVLASLKLGRTLLQKRHHAFLEVAGLTAFALQLPFKV
jgi:hypothetical protein